MQILRLVLVIAITAGLCHHLVGEVLSALKTGKIRYGRAQGERVAHRKKQPLTFAFTVFTFIFISLVSVTAAAWVTLDVFTKIH